MADPPPSPSLSSARQLPQPPGLNAPRLNLAGGHQLVKVECAKCKAHLNVSTSSHTFTCPNDFCRQLQALPEQLRRPAEGAQAPLRSTQFHCPSPTCNSLLNVPIGLQNFLCPRCLKPITVGRNGGPSTISQPMRGAAGFLAPPLGPGNLAAGRYPFHMPAQPPEEIHEMVLDVEREEGEEAGAGDTFMDYRASKLAYGLPHPDPIVETTSLSAVQPPDPTYEPKIRGEVETSGCLSSLQMESIVYASQRHDQMLPDGSRAGFFLGDGAGVGKGRTVAGLVWENWLQGRRKALWLSVASDLKFDSRRDLDDVGASEVEVHALNKLPYGKLDSKSIGIHEGVVFLTYSSLIATSEKGRSRLQQLVQWFKPDFDGLIVFDECHKAKNLVPESGGNATRTGEAVQELQTKLPNARIVYCSATGASEPRNLGYMVRLGLWGPRTAFSSFPDFLTMLEKRGVGALELVAMDMKARGMYVCRTLSFKGADFDIVEVPLEPKMKEMYTHAASFWDRLRLDLLLAIETVADGKQKSNSLWRYFWASHQRFFRHMCMAAKVHRAVSLAKDAVASGRSVVIGLQSTGEARTEEAVSKYGEELDDFVSGPRELLIKLVEDNYPMFDEPSDEIGADGHVASLQLPARSSRSKTRAGGAPEAGPSGRNGKRGKAEPQVTRSSRGRVLKKPKYEEPDSDDELWIEEEETSSEEEGKDGEASDQEVELFRPCYVCLQEQEGDVLLLKCSKCDKAAHAACLTPPLMPPKEDTPWLCPACDKTDQEARAQREALIKDQWAKYNKMKAAKELWLEIIRTKLELPNNPLDEVIDQLGGPEKVAEMTGRKGMLVRNLDGKGVTWRARNSKEVSLEMINMVEKQKFMDGEKLVAVISEAASAGISIQADRRALNQRRRVHITLELPWSADKAIQQFGRTHRSNQASAPEYRLLFTNLGGEKRFASIVAKRLESLGALTQGDRRAGPSLGAYNYDSYWGKRALAAVYKAINAQIPSPAPPPGCKRSSPEEARFITDARAALVSCNIIQDSTRAGSIRGMASGRITESDMYDVARFLNRLLGLEPGLQNSLFDFFVANFDALVLEARRTGHFDTGIVEMRGARVALDGEPEEVFREASGSAATLHCVVKVDRGLPFEDASAALEAAPAEDPGNGFYISRREWLGRKHSLLAVRSFDSSAPLFTIYRPASGRAGREMPQAELRLKYEQVASEDAAKAAWTMDFDASASQCMHGPKCKWQSACSVGRRVNELHILNGLILPVWGIVEKALSKQERIGDRRLRVVRLEMTDDGRRVVGVHVPTPAIASVLEGLKRPVAQLDKV